MPDNEKGPAAADRQGLVCFRNFSILDEPEYGLRPLEDR
jgi:hypothetical protein